MFSNSRTWIVEWGDCDPAGIVFYPRFFAAFDTSTSRLLEAALGMKKADILSSNGIIGWPMVDTRARFAAPASYGDEVLIETEITKVGRSSFELVHRLSKQGALCNEGWETRVWAAPAPDGQPGIRAVPLPDALAETLRSARVAGQYWKRGRRACLDLRTAIACSVKREQKCLLHAGEQSETFGGYCTWHCNSCVIPEANATGVQCCASA